MNTIMRKLRSRKGASMILAMVFMLFCLFVGGSVLAAAAENGYRVEHLSDQQQYLDERSAALLICDQLKTDAGKPLRLTIQETENTIQYVLIVDGGVVVETGGDPIVTKSVTIQAPANLNMTAMQRLVLESAVWRYFEEKGTDLYGSGSVALTLSNFTYDGNAVTSLNDFWVKHSLLESEPPEGSDPAAGSGDVSGTISIAGERTGDASSIANFAATFACGTGDNLYDFTVDFGDFTQMTVVMDGYSGEKDPVTTTAITTYNGQFARITTVSRQVAISWENPVIEKGGA